VLAVWVTAGSVDSGIENSRKPTFTFVNLAPIFNKTHNARIPIRIPMPIDFQWMLKGSFGALGGAPAVGVG
jgi:hypothetical protein